MGAIHLTTADTTLINFFMTALVSVVASLAGAIVFLYKTLTAKIDKCDIDNQQQIKILEDRHKECEDENKTLKVQMVELLHKFADLKEELGFLKGLIKNTKTKEVASLANHNTNTRYK